MKFSSVLKKGHGFSKHGRLPSYGTASRSEEFIPPPMTYSPPFPLSSGHCRARLQYFQTKIEATEMQREHIKKIQKRSGGSQVLDNEKLELNNRLTTLRRLHKNLDNIKYVIDCHSNQNAACPDRISVPLNQSVPAYADCLDDMIRYKKKVLDRTIAGGFDNKKINRKINKINDLGSEFTQLNLYMDDSGIRMTEGAF